MRSHLITSSLNPAPVSTLPPAPSGISDEIKVSTNNLDMNNILIRKSILAEHLKKIEYKADTHHRFDNNAAIQESISSLFNLAPGTLDQLMKEDLKAFGQIFGIEGHAIKATTFPQVLEMIVKEKTEQGEVEQKEYLKVMRPDVNNKDVTHFGGWLREKFLLYFLCFMVECYSKLRANAWGNLPTQIGKHVNLEKVLLNEIWILVNAYKLYESYKSFSQPIAPTKGENKAQRKRAIEDSKIIENLLAAIIANDAPDEFEYILPCGSSEHAVYIVLLHIKDKNSIYVRIDDSSSQEVTTFKPYTLDPPGREKLAAYLKKVLLQLSESNNDAAMDEIYQRDVEDILLPQDQADYPKMAKQTGPNCVVAGFMRGMRLRLNIKDTPRDALFSWLFREVKRFVTEDHETKQEPQSVYAEQLELINRAYTLSPVSRLEQIKQELYENYKKRAVMFEFAPHQPKPITVSITENTFIHLALVSQGQQQQKEREIRKKLKQEDSYEEEKGENKKAANDKNETFQRQQLLNSWEMLSQVQEPIDINDLWLPLKNDQNIPQHLLIEGSAGIGKTTLCGFITAQWSQKQLWSERFTWVLWLPLRNLIDTTRYPQLANYNYSFKSFVLGECFGCLPNAEEPQLTIDEQDELCRQLKEQSENVLYVLDGYDEIADYERRPDLSHLKSAISQLLQSKHILLTTRPQMINDELLPEKQTRRLVTLGLSDENIPPYVEQYFQTISNHCEEKQVNSVEEKHYDSAPLLEGLKANQTLWSISHIPLHLSLICLAYAEGKLQAADLKLGFSLTKLYQQIVNLLLRRYLKEKLKGTEEIEAARVTVDISELEDIIQLEPHMLQLTQFLEYLAFRGMGQYDLILSNSLLIESLKTTQQKLAIIRPLIASGLLKEINDQGKPAYQFVHLTFQEFFAARYLARKFQQPQTSTNDWIERFHEYKHIPRFAVMLWFTAGLLKDNPLCLQQFLQLLQAPPRDEVGLYHFSLIMRCVAEAGYPKELTAQVSHHLGQLVEKSWLAIREGRTSVDPHKKMRAQSAQQVLQWLVELRLLTPKIEFPVLSLNTIVKDLSDENSAIRQTAALALGELKTPTPEILQALVALLKDNDRDVRQAAARALGELKTPNPEILQALIALLKDNDRDVRQATIEALGKLKTPTPEILQALVALLQDNESSVRQAAAQALGELKAPAAEILENFVALLKDNNYRVRQAAARALGELKTPNPEILQALIALLKDNDRDVRQATIEALGKLKTPNPEILQALITLLKDEDYSVRQAAARALGELKTPNPEILQALIALLKDNDHNVRQATIEALGKLKTPTLEILQALVAFLKDENEWVRLAVARALGELKAPTPEILQALVTLLKDDSSGVREASARALGELKASTPEILQDLVALLKDNSYFGSNVRQAAARALGELKASTPEILQSLVALLKDENYSVRQAATEVLNNFSITFLLNAYFKTSQQQDQSSLQDLLLSFIFQRWITNRQVVKFVNQEIHWLEQGQWQHMLIPDNHPYFHYHVTKALEEVVGQPLCIIFSKLSEAKDSTHFSPRRPPISQQLADQKPLGAKKQSM